VAKWSTSQYTQLYARHMLRIYRYTRVYLTSNTKIIVLKIIQSVERVSKIRRVERVRRVRVKIAYNSGFYFI